VNGLIQARTIPEFLQKIDFLEARINELRHRAMIHILMGRPSMLDEVLAFAVQARHGILNQAKYWQSLHPDDYGIRMILTTWGKPPEEEQEMTEMINRPWILTPVISLQKDPIFPGEKLTELGEEAKRLFVSRLRCDQLEDGVFVDNAGENDTLTRYLYPKGPTASRLKRERIPEDERGLYRLADELEAVLPQMGRRFDKHYEKELDLQEVRERDLGIVKKKIAFEEAHWRWIMSQKQDFITRAA